MWYPPESVVPSRNYSQTVYYYHPEAQLCSSTMKSAPDVNDSTLNCQRRPDVLPATTNNVYISHTGSYAQEMSTRPINVKKPVNPPTSIARWDWLLFSPDYYSDCYTPSASSSVNSTTVIDEWTFSHLLTSLPTWLLTLLTLIPTSSSDLNENEVEDLPHSSSIEYASSLLSSSPSSIGEKDTKSNRSSTPDTDDGYQSASDYSHSLSSQPFVDSTLIHPQRLSYAAATVKPQSNLSTTNSKGKQIINNSLSTISDGNENGSNNGNPKLKFIAPRFERMHHAKQSSSTSTSASSMKNGSISRTSHRTTTNPRSSMNNATRRR